MAREYAQNLNEPVVERTVDIEFKRANGMGDPFNRVALSVRKVIHRVDAPFVAGAVVGGILDPVQNGVAHQHVRRSHVDLRPQHLLPFGIFPGFHFAEQPQILLNGSVPVRTFNARGLHRTAPSADLLLCLVVHVGLALLDQLLRPGVKLVEIVRCIAFLRPLEAHPTDVLLDGIDIFDVLLHGIGVVIAQIRLAAIFQREPEIQADAFGMPQMQVTVGLRRESGYDALHFPGLQILFDDFLQEIQITRLLGSGLHSFIHITYEL